MLWSCCNRRGNLESKEQYACFEKKILVKHHVEILCHACAYMLVRCMLVLKARSSMLVLKARCWKGIMIMLHAPNTVGFASEHIYYTCCLFRRSSKWRTDGHESRVKMDSCHIKCHRSTLPSLSIYVAFNGNL